MSRLGQLTNNGFPPPGSCRYRSVVNTKRRAKCRPAVFLVLTPGGWECSNLEPEPFFGSTEEELRECVDDGFALLSYVEVTFKGRRVTNLDDYVVTSGLDTLPPNNLLSSQAGLTMDKGYFLMLHPLSRGTHTLRAYNEFAALDFQAGITYTIIVG